MPDSCSVIWSDDEDIDAPCIAIGSRKRGADAARMPGPIPKYTSQADWEEMRLIADQSWKRHLEEVEQDAISDDIIINDTQMFNRSVSEAALERAND